MILPAADKSFELSVPVLVIGAGACGISAALTAKENGAETMLLERDDTPTGSSALSTCLIPAAGTKLQMDAGVADSPEQFAKDLIAKAKNKNDPDMARWVAEASGPTVDWLVDTVGLPLSLLTGFKYPGHSVWRMHGSPNRTGTELMAVLTEAAAREAIDLATSAPVTDLYADQATGRVTGVRITRPDGATEDIGCDALILACNGYGGNPEMVRQYLPEMSDAWYFGHTGNKGDAVHWGVALGGAVADMGGYQGHGAVTQPHGTLLFWGLLTEGGIQVNLNGERFSNEVRGYSEQAVEVIGQPEAVAWEIWDEGSHKLGLDFLDYRNGIEMGAHKTADTVEGIAQQSGVPLDTLKQTFADIEAYKRGDKEDPWGRDWGKTELLEPPYHFAKITGALFHTQGGLVVNDKAQVLREDGTPLPNLFAGGGAARGLSGPSRWGYLSGNGLLTAAVLGRIAGREAAKMVKR
ncbi:MAG: FAD-dependent oxidoreductase [Alphaproteobacteria bacterium]|nr:FAD-dependent oxidoreductase [Alphaproteobacteria bacterium]